ncbi:MAG TPA: VTT domain-containing protein [Candidatus Paceibacterota bacterium]|nr:VTT domain-containing protein [Candidatus Paceibacterota bacterium]
MKEFEKILRESKQRLLHWDTLLLAAFFIVLLAGSFLFQKQAQAVIMFAQHHALLGGFLYVAFLALSIVIVPLSSIPITIFVVPIWGLFWGGFLSGFGWWFGSILLFLISRHAGRPFLSRFFSFQNIDKWEQKIPDRVTFLGIVLAHMVLPTEIPSIVFGFVKKLPFRTYASASVFGMFPMAYLIVATGGAIFSKNWTIAVIFGVVLLLVFLIAFFVWRKYFLR